MKSYFKKALSFVVALVLVISVGSVTAFANEKDQAEIIIGQYDGPLSEVWVANTPLPKSAYNLRVRSYAKYDKNDGIQVTVRLYSWLSENPEFTSMAGTVTVDLNGKKKSTAFTKSAKGTSDIEKEINTGVTGNSRDKGKVSVDGVATARKALANGGTFAIEYDVTIP